MREWDGIIFLSSPNSICDNTGVSRKSKGVSEKTAGILGRETDVSNWSIIQMKYKDIPKCKDNFAFYEGIVTLKKG
jgi:hypothetical protein